MMGLSVMYTEASTLLNLLFEVKRPEGYLLDAALCLYFDKNIIELYNDNSSFLSSYEKEYFNKLKFERRQNSYLLGRYAAKKAVATLYGTDTLNTICIENGILGNPILKYPKDTTIQVSITHSKNISGAVAYPLMHPMAIDIEEIKNDFFDIQSSFICQEELDLLKNSQYTYLEKLAMTWTAKEALSKLLKTGLTTSFNIFKISRYDFFGKYWICYFDQFTQYQVLSFITEGYAFSIAYPKRSELQIDIKRLIKNIMETK